MTSRMLAPRGLRFRAWGLGGLGAWSALAAGMAAAFTPLAVLAQQPLNGSDVARVLAIEAAVLLGMALIPVVILLIARRNMQGWGQPVSYVWFSFSGRLNRKAYWLKGALLLSLVLFGAQLLSVAVTLVVTMSFGADSTVVNAVSTVVALPVFVFQLWASSAVAVKRAHDLDHSGWWVLGILIPIWNIWVGIQLAFFPGTAGLNRFGDDPIDRYGAYMDELAGGPDGGGEAAQDDAPRAQAHPHHATPDAAPRGFGTRKFAPPPPPAAPVDVEPDAAPPAASMGPGGELDMITRRLGSDILRPTPTKPRH